MTGKQKRPGTIALTPEQKQQRLDAIRARHKGPEVIVSYHWSTVSFLLGLIEEKQGELDELRAQLTAQGEQGK